MSHEDGRLSLQCTMLAAVVLSVVALGLTTVEAFAEPSDAYQFPIRPGTPEWAALKTHADMLAATQVPPSILQGMSTEGLVETCLNYPLLFEIDVYSAPQDGLEKVSARFNGLQELLHRADGGAKLLQRYRTMDPAAIPAEWGASERGDYALTISHLEIILAQDLILRGMTRSALFELLAESLRKAEARRTRPNTYGFSSQERAAFLVARILEVAGLIDSTHVWVSPMRERVQAFLRTGFGADPTLTDAIMLAARELLQLRSE